MTKIEKKLTELGIKWEDISQYEIAFTHPSYAKENKKPQSNQVYEFLGDAVFNLMVTEYIFDNTKGKDEGYLSKYKAALISRSAMNHYNKKLKLNECLLLGKGEEKTGGRNKESNIEDLFEAFIAAIYLDLGLDGVIDFFEQHIVDYINEDIMTINKDYKTMLQEVLQGERINDISYVIVKEEGQAHCRKFTVAVNVEGMTYGVGTGTSKQKAEKDAAMHALEKLSKTN